MRPSPGVVAPAPGCQLQRRTFRMQLGFWSEYESEPKLIEARLQLEGALL